VVRFGFIDSGIRRPSWFWLNAMRTRGKCLRYCGWWARHHEPPTPTRTARSRGAAACGLASAMNSGRCRLIPGLTLPARVLRHAWARGRRGVRTAVRNPAVD